MVNQRVSVTKLLLKSSRLRVASFTMMTTNPANDIVRQASQGSVAAIIQVLNETLADSGVRTRAMLADGVLQLLCEAATAEQLDSTTLVDRIRQILESLAPRQIRRVHINSRIVREQQLLWLDEISRDPGGQLLWSEDITLKQPNFLQRWFSDRQAERQPATTFMVRSPRQMRERRQFWRGGLVGGGTVAALLLLGWIVYSRTSPAPTALQTTNAVSPREVNTSISAPPIASKPSSDPFATAVRLAEQASREGQIAKSAAEWRTLADRWQQASDLMAAVPSSDGRYKTAQDRISLYRENSQAARQKAE